MPRTTGQHARVPERTAPADMRDRFAEAVEGLTRAVEEASDLLAGRGDRPPLLISEHLCEANVHLERVLAEAAEQRESWDVGVSSFRAGWAAHEAAQAPAAGRVPASHRRPSHLQRIQELGAAVAAATAGRMTGALQTGAAISAAGAAGAMIAIVPGAMTPAAPAPVVVRIAQAAAPHVAASPSPVATPSASPSGTGAATPPTSSPSPSMSSSAAACPPAATASPAPAGGSSGSPAPLPVQLPPVTVTLPSPLPSVTVTVPPVVASVISDVPAVVQQVAKLPGDVLGDHAYAGRHRLSVPRRHGHHAGGW